MTASIVLAGFEDLLPVIIFFVVIGRIFGALKKTSSGTKKPSSPAGGGRKIEADLQKFFESIAAQQGYTQKEPPPPPPVPAARKARPVAQARRVETAQPSPAAAPPEPYQPAIKPWSGKPFGPAVPKRSTCSAQSSQARAELIRMIKDEDSIRKAVLLREILGPPVSMRS